MPVCSDDDTHVFDDTMNGPTVLSDNDTSQTDVIEEESAASSTEGSDDEGTDSTLSVVSDHPEIEQATVNHYIWQQRIVTFVQFVGVCYITYGVLYR